MADFLTAHNTPNRSNFTGAVGCAFTVSVGIVITRLGRFYDAGSTRDHVVSLWRQLTPPPAGTGTLLGQGTVTAASASDSNGYKWVTLGTPVILLPGNTYAIGVDETSGQDNWPDQAAGSTFDNHFGSIAARNSSTQGTFPGNAGNGGQTYDTPNMQNVWDFFLTDAMTLSDGLVKAFGMLEVFADQMAQTDSVKVQASVTAPAADQIVMSDAAVNLILGMTEKITGEQMSQADAFAKLMDVAPHSFSDQMTQADSVRLGYGLVLPGENANNLSDFIDVNAIKLAFSDSINFWADGSAGGSIGFGARVSQDVLEAMIKGKPTAFVSQVVLEVMIRRYYGSRIWISI